MSNEQFKTLEHLTILIRYNLLKHSLHQNKHEREIIKKLIESEGKTLDFYDYPKTIAKYKKQKEYNKKRPAIIKSLVLNLLIYFLVSKSYIQRLEIHFYELCHHNLNLTYL